MKKLTLLSLTLFFTTLSAMAVPAKRGQWRTIRQADGTEMRVQLRGDERFHYFESVEGQLFVKAADALTYTPITADYCAQRQKARAGKSKAQPRSQAVIGKKKGLIVLAEFKDQKFKAGHDLALYKQIANGERFTNDDGFVGSVKDYFKDNSYGKFELDFDVLGPITLSQNVKYYGGNDYYGDDQAPGEMIVEAMQAIDSQVNFADYDWDGDGEVEQVYVLYAGLGEAAGGSENTIWPHMWQLNEALGAPLTLDGVKINTYACSSEQTVDDDDNIIINGIGTFCHEFSHCLGFPDFYDTNYKAFGMDTWSIMDYGSYNGNGFIPAAYTSYERMAAGWLMPIELKEETCVSGMKALTEGGESYIVYNDAHPDEYYLLENRQQTGWDEALYGHGVLILHIDYDADAWYYNEVNTSSSHQRCTIFHADNSNGATTLADLAGDPYPYRQNNSLTNSSVPAAKLFNTAPDGKKLMSKPITDITVDDNGVASFNFTVGNSDIPDPDPGIEGSVLFRETFSGCEGDGGNDGVFGAINTSPDIVYDNDGWQAEKAFAGFGCGRFGSSKVPGTCTTPYFTINGDCQLSFRAAVWGSDGTDLTVKVNGQAQEIFTMTAGEWVTYTLPLTGDGPMQITFAPIKRFFLDDVVVTANSSDAISTLTQEPSALATKIYNISGQYVGTDINALRPGIYIINKKRVLIN